MAHKHDDNHGSHSPSNGSSHDGGHHPLVPIRVYVITLLSLLVLTVLTVGISYVDLGKFNIVANIGIATMKASLVMIFFMGLKYDTNLNRAFILSSFVALVIMIGITATDLWTRPKPDPVVVKAAKSEMTPENFAEYQKGSPALLAKGKDLYDTNCAVCHGAGGMGDGAGGASLSPKPRNFHSEGGTWTHGNTASSIYHTLAIGSPGTGMASYKSLLPEDRWALVHYVIAFAPNVQRVGKTDTQGLAMAKEEAAGGGGAAKASVPVDFAMERLAQ